MGFSIFVILSEPSTENWDTSEVKWAWTPLEEVVPSITPTAERAAESALAPIEAAGPLMVTEGTQTDPEDERATGSHIIIYM
jgi:hypothetical protein